MNTNNINENLNNSNVELNEYESELLSMDYQKTLEEEQKVFEFGVEDEIDILDMDESDINEQTKAFLSIRDKE